MKVRQTKFKLKLYVVTLQTWLVSAGVCEVVATVRGVSRTKTSAYTYDASLVSTVTGVSPTRGGTGGGTLITISGTNFGWGS